MLKVMMIDFIDEKYGRVIIFEPLDVPRQSPYLPDELIDKYYNIIPIETVRVTSIIAFRSPIEREVKILQNRYGSNEDYEIEQFVLNYGVKKEEEEIFESINSRFEILDL